MDTVIKGTWGVEETETEGTGFGATVHTFRPYHAINNGSRSYRTQQRKEEG